MTEFPSVEWFQQAADLLNNSDSSKRLGTTDTVMGVQVDEKIYEIVFDAFEITTIREIDQARAEELDFVLVQSLEAWRAMLEDIKQNGQATHEFTLNSLDLRSDTELAIGKDYNKRDAFYRFNQTFQDYFDMTAKIDTTYPVAVG